MRPGIHHLTTAALAATLLLGAASGCDGAAVRGAAAGVSPQSDPFAVPRDGRENRPEQRRIAFGDDPKTSVRVAWCVDSRPSKPAVREPRLVVRRKDAAASERPFPVVRRAYPQETYQPYEATADGLEPGVAYEYRIEGAHGESAWAGFRTAPAVPEAFRFTAYGDQGTWKDSEAVTKRAAALHPDFHLMLGDISYANGDQRVWDVYGRQIDAFASVVPFMAVVGNHDYEKYGEVVIGPAAFLARFALPGQELNYVFDYAGVRFVVVDAITAQEAIALLWLETQLKAAREAGVRRIVVAQHFPHFGSAKGRGYNVPLLAKQGPIFDRYHVDLVLAGHDHFYERTFPIRENRAASTERSRYARGAGTIHLTIGGGGGKLYEFQPGPVPPTTCVREAAHCLTVCSVLADGTVEVATQRPDGTILDAFTLAP